MLARHYGFTAEPACAGTADRELDFILNYDVCLRRRFGKQVKYRRSRSAEPAGRDTEGNEQRSGVAGNRAGQPAEVLAAWRSRMKLPNAQSAPVAERKVTHYLLNPAHPAGGSKARLFLRFGFTLADWQRLAEALLRHAQENEVVATEETSHGRRYVVDGTLTAPDGTSLNVRSAWYISPGSDAPRFVTAHPLLRL